MGESEFGNYNRNWFHGKKVKEPISIPLSNLQRERKDDAAITLREAVEAIVDDPDRRWSDEEMLVIGLATQALKAFLQRNLPK